MSERSPQAIGARLRRLRESLGDGITQAEFAKSVGLPFNRYNNFERGVSPPRLDAAQAIVDQYQVTLDWIYDGKVEGLPLNIYHQLYPARRTA